MGRVRDERGSGSTAAHTFQSGYYTSGTDEQHSTTSQLKLRQMYERVRRVQESRKEKKPNDFSKKKLRCLRSFSQLVMYQQHELVYQQKNGLNREMKKVEGRLPPFVCHGKKIRSVGAALSQWFRPCFAARNEFELATARGAGFTSFEQRSRKN